MEMVHHLDGLVWEPRKPFAGCHSQYETTARGRKVSVYYSWEKGKWFCEIEGAGIPHACLCKQLNDVCAEALLMLRIETEDTLPFDLDFADGRKARCLEDANNQIVAVVPSSITLDEVRAEVDRIHAACSISEEEAQRFLETGEFSE